jgi:hypothetical protein
VFSKSLVSLPSSIRLIILVHDQEFSKPPISNRTNFGDASADDGGVLLDEVKELLMKSIASQQNFGNILSAENAG